MTKLIEGMRPNDLKGLVRNILSVDEYQSKIDPRAVVIAFYVSGMHAADDLNRFLQKSPVELLDTEVSAAPNQDGDYLVFVEMAMNDRAAKATAIMCGELQSLTDIGSWEVHVRGCEPSQAVKPAEIEAVIRDTLKFSLSEFFSTSDLTRVQLVESFWKVSSSVNQMIFRVNDFGSFESVVKRNKLNESAVDLSPEAIRSCKHIRSMLGNDWAVEKVGDSFAVYQDNSDALILLAYSPL